MYTIHNFAPLGGKMKKMMYLSLRIKADSSIALDYKIQAIIHKQPAKNVVCIFVAR